MTLVYTYKLQGSCDFRQPIFGRVEGKPKPPMTVKKVPFISSDLFFFFQWPASIFAWRKRVFGFCFSPRYTLHKSTVAPNPVCFWALHRQKGHEERMCSFLFLRTETFSWHASLKNSLNAIHPIQVKHTGFWGIIPLLFHFLNCSRLWYFGIWSHNLQRPEPHIQMYQNYFMFLLQQYTDAIQFGTPDHCNTQHKRD